MTLPSAAPAPADDQRCVRCGYSLIGLDSRRPCPECGLLAGFSLLDGRELRHNRPRWLRSLMAGAILLAIALPTLPLIGASVAALGMAAPSSGWGWAPRGTDWLVFAMGCALGLPPSMALLAGVWLLTGRAGRQRMDGTSNRARVLLRLLAAAPLPMIAFWALIAVDLLQTDPLMDYSIVAWMLLIAALAILLAWLFWHLKALAERAPAPLLAADSPVIGMALAAGILGSYLIWLIAYLDTDASMFASGAVGDIMMFLTAVVFGLGLTAAIWSIYLLIRYAIAFGRSARQARQLMADFDASRNPAAVVYDPPP